MKDRLARLGAADGRDGRVLLCTPALGVCLLVGKGDSPRKGEAAAVLSAAKRGALEMGSWGRLPWGFDALRTEALLSDLAWLSADAPHSKREWQDGVAQTADWAPPPPESALLRAAGDTTRGDQKGEDFSLAVASAASKFLELQTTRSELFREVGGWGRRRTSFGEGQQRPPVVRGAALADTGSAAFFALQMACIACEWGELRRDFLDGCSALTPTVREFSLSRARPALVRAALPFSQSPSPSPSLRFALETAALVGDGASPEASRHFGGLASGGRQLGRLFLGSLIRTPSSRRASRKCALLIHLPVGQRKGPRPLRLNNALVGVQEAAPLKTAFGCFEVRGRAGSVCSGCPFSAKASLLPRR